MVFAEEGFGRSRARGRVRGRSLLLALPLARSRQERAREDSLRTIPGTTMPGTSTAVDGKLRFSDEDGPGVSWGQFAARVEAVEGAERARNEVVGAKEWRAVKNTAGRAATDERRDSLCRDDMAIDMRVGRKAEVERQEGKLPRLRRRARRVRRRTPLAERRARRCNEVRSTRL